MKGTKLLYAGPGSVHSWIEVVEEKGVRQMRFGRNGGWQGALDLARPDRPVFPYQRAFTALVEAHGPIRSFLSVGVGSGTSLHHVRRIHREAGLHGVEIDETVLSLAIEFFQAPSHRDAEYWIGDGVQFVASSHASTYDLIFVDAYLKASIYQPCLEPATASCLARITSDRGTVVYNLIASSYRSAPLKRFLQALRPSFPVLLDLPVGLPLTAQNRLLIASRDEELASRFRQTCLRAGASDLERLSWSLRLSDVSEP
ncbi:spermidine synthase [Alicyclobacillus vulcanalis]|uniref:Spermine/spermidine synthase n=1 Tax=Alicyclobacillus vulcanalis TaxID=252246 RepID=A0A1N7KLE5_9BACL|nr:spermidine synthase [Alicyclobacillus vulcanalis]SIS62336.1 Spermine/spermidine synthase [Alicyclobacillus vulcanalis]